MATLQGVRSEQNCYIIVVIHLLTYLKVVHALAEDVGAAELVGVVVRGAPVVLVFAAICLLWA